MRPPHCGKRRLRSARSRLCRPIRRPQRLRRSARMAVASSPGVTVGSSESGTPRHAASLLACPPATERCCRRVMTPTASRSRSGSPTERSCSPMDHLAPRAKRCKCPARASTPWRSVATVSGSRRPAGWHGPRSWVRWQWPDPGPSRTHWPRARRRHQRQREPDRQRRAGRNHPACGPRPPAKVIRSTRVERARRMSASVPTGV